MERLIFSQNTPTVRKPPRLKVHSVAMPMEEALRAGVPLPPLKEVRASIEAFPGNIEEALPSWTGTCAAYTEPGKTFRETAVEIHGRPYVEYVEKGTGKSWYYPIPSYFLDVANGVLLSDWTRNDDLKAEGGRRIMLINDSTIRMMANLPVKCTYYMPDTEFGIPAGNELEPTTRDDAVYLWREANGRVGLIAAGGGRIIDMMHEPSRLQGVVTY